MVNIISYSLANDLNVNTLTAKESVSIINGPNMSNDGIDMNRTKISNLVPGVDGTDAVNVNQLNSLKGDIYKTGAAAAALSGLHPFEYDPDNKVNIAAAIGHYKDKGAFAIGAFYRPTENMMFSLASTIGEANTIYNMGGAFKVGHGNRYSQYSKLDMVTKINDLTEENKVFKKKVENQEQRINMLEEQLRKI